MSVRQISNEQMYYLCIDREGYCKKTIFRGGGGGMDDDLRKLILEDTHTLNSSKTIADFLFFTYSFVGRSEQSKHRRQKQ